MNSKPRLLIFDLDGTLVDSAHDIVTAVNGLAVDRGLQPIPADVIRATIGEGLRQLVHDLFPEGASDAVFLSKLERDLLARYDRHLLDTTKPFAGVEEFLESAHEKVAILSNKHEAFIHKTLAALELDRFPWVRVYGGDSLPTRKPDPAPFLDIMRAAGVAPAETVMIGDGIPDLVGANACGIRSIACAFGYTERDRLEKHKPTAWTTSYFELRSIINSLS